VYMVINLLLPQGRVISWETERLLASQGDPRLLVMLEADSTSRP
jgi:hypothetical protein